MEISIKNQLITMLFSIILGMFIGLIYDIFKILRLMTGLELSPKMQNKLNKIRLPLIVKKNNKKSNNTKKYILYIIWDILFCIAITPIIQIFVYATSFGIFRWYILIGIALGFTCYYYTVSKIIAPVYEFILLGIWVVFKYILYFIKLPIIQIEQAIKNKPISIRKEKQSKRKKDNKSREIVLSMGENK